jgi:transposase InsO family protein
MFASVLNACYDGEYCLQEQPMMEEKNMASKIRKKKQSRWRSVTRRRWQDLQQAKQKKYTGTWTRRDRRRKAFHVMKGRLKSVRAYWQFRQQGMTESEAAQRTAETYRCSLSTVRNYARKWRTEGKRGLMPTITVRPYPPKTPWWVIQLILLLRRVLHWGGHRIAAELKSRKIYEISGQGVYKLFKRYRVYTRTYRPVGARKGIQYTTWNVNAVNEVWHCDFAGPFVTKTGRKCWGFLVVDAYSRRLLALTVVESLETQIVLDILADVFLEYGSPKMIVTDNGTTFTSVWENGDHAFTAFLDRCGITHHRIPPYYPEANGKAEAAVKIVKHEALQPFFQAMPAWTPGQLQQLLTRFQSYYNSGRLHGGIGWQTPDQRWYTKGDEPPKGVADLFFVNEPEFDFAFC